MKATVSGRVGEPQFDYCWLVELFEDGKPARYFADVKRDSPPDTKLITDDAWAAMRHPHRDSAEGFIAMLKQHGPLSDGDWRATEHGFSHLTANRT